MGGACIIFSRIEANNGNISEKIIVLMPTPFYLRGKNFVPFSLFTFVLDK